MRSFRFTVFFTVFFIVVLYCLSFTLTISANNVDIQAAIEKANDGDVIIVPDGEYEQQKFGNSKFKSPKKNKFQTSEAF